MLSLVDIGADAHLCFSVTIKVEIGNWTFFLLVK